MNSSQSTIIPGAVTETLQVLKANPYLFTVYTDTELTTDAIDAAYKQKHGAHGSMYFYDSVRLPEDGGRRSAILCIQYCGDATDIVYSVQQELPTVRISCRFAGEATYTEWYNIESQSDRELLVHRLNSL
jgi:hypothetical protein